MVKIERRKTDKSKAALVSLQVEKEKCGTYNTFEVNSALNELFYGKCYICENKEGSSYQIEHLIPHKGDIDLKFDWNNLFWVCAHCNNVKLAKYDNILDCTKEDIDRIISFRRKGYFGQPEELEFEALDDREETLNTVALLKSVYYGETPQKKIEAKILRRKLRKEISKFKELVREYKETDGEEKEDLKILLERELKNSSEFVAFKKWLIRDNQDYYSDLLPYVI